MKTNKNISAKKKWEIYEEIASELLSKFADKLGLSYVEGKQRIEGRITGTDWEIDAKGIKEDNEGFIIIECRRHTTRKINQEAMGSLAYRIQDTGVVGGIMVSPLGHQEGAKKVASIANIVEVKLSPDSNNLEYFLGFLNQVMMGVHDTIHVKDTIEVIKN